MFKFDVINEWSDHVEVVDMEPTVNLCTSTV